MARQLGAGRDWAGAQALCRQALKSDPGHGPALHLLGRLAQEQGHAEAAVSWLAQALAVMPQEATWHRELADLLHRAGKTDQAIPHWQQAVALAPDDDATRHTLAQALLAQKHYAPAAEHYQYLAQRRPASLEVFLALGQAYEGAGQWTQAADLYRQAAQTHPQSAPAYAGLGRASLALGSLSEAMASATKAMELSPTTAAHHLSLGQVLQAQGATDAAIAAYSRALALAPADATLPDQIDEPYRELAVLEITIAQLTQQAHDHPADIETQFQLGVALARRRRYDPALAAFARVLDLEPGHVGALNNMALLLAAKGRMDEALTLLRQAVADHPHLPLCQSNYLYTLHFPAAVDRATLVREHHAWYTRHARALAPSLPAHPRHDRTPDRRLRIGYVSPDFRLHPIGRFLSAFFPHLDHTHFETIAYSSVPQEDALTHDLRSHADHWVPVRHLDDAALADRIRGDQVDILVDLTMHMGGNRLLMMARKPAPVQVTYLAYCSTTGLPAIDYRLTDPYLDPPPPETNHVACGDETYVEQPAVLPHTYWCYQPPAGLPEVGPLPAQAHGHVTFASLNNFSKVSPQVLRLWARVLGACTDSRLLLHTVQGDHRDQVLALFREQGITPDRISFLDHVPLAEFFSTLAHVDIALDPFPYPGGTTTCDALWMGLPVITLAGTLPHTRSGVSILSNAGLPELIANTPEQYLATAVQLAHDLPRLAHLRRTLRPRMQQSPLMDGPAFARDLEATYRRLWRHWCRS